MENSYPKGQKTEKSANKAVKQSVRQKAQNNVETDKNVTIKQKPTNIEPEKNADKSAKQYTKQKQTQNSVEDKKRQKKNSSVKWVFAALILTLILSFAFSIASEIVIASAPLWVAYAVITVLVVISVMFDIIGTAAAACDVEPFLAMAAKKLKGAKKAVYLAKHANVVSSISGDIIGDICGIVSGACGAVIVAMQFVSSTSTISMLLSVTFSSVLAAITVTGKAIGKQFALSNANAVILAVARILSIFDKKGK